MILVIAELADVVVAGRKIVECNVGYFTNPQHPYTKGLLACRPPLEKDIHSTNSK